MKGNPFSQSKARRARGFTKQRTSKGALCKAGNRLRNEFRAQDADEELREYLA